MYDPMGRFQHFSFVRCLYFLLFPHKPELVLHETYISREEKVLSKLYHVNFPRKFDSQVHLLLNKQWRTPTTQAPDKGTYLPMRIGSCTWVKRRGTSLVIYPVVLLLGTECWALQLLKSYRLMMTWTLSPHSEMLPKSSFISCLFAKCSYAQGLLLLILGD